MQYIITPHIPRKIKKELRKVSIEWDPIGSPFYLNRFSVKVEGKQNKWTGRLVTLLRRDNLQRIRHLYKSALPSVNIALQEICFWPTISSGAK